MGRTLLAFFLVFLPIFVCIPQGVVRGQADYYLGGQYLMPAQNVRLILADVIVEIGWAVAGPDSPRVLTDVDGNFAFYRVAKGWYALGIETPFGVMPLIDAIDGVCWAFYVEEGTTMEVLARLDYQLTKWQAGQNIEGDGTTKWEIQKTTCWWW